MIVMMILNSLGIVMDWLFTLGSIAGLIVLEYSYLDLICMIWDRIFHGLKIF